MCIKRQLIFYIGLSMMVTRVFAGCELEIGPEWRKLISGSLS